MTLDQILPSLQVPMSALWLIADIAESKGKQELYARQSPQMLKALRETALIQSVESSNRIEGVTLFRQAAEMRATGKASTTRLLSCGQDCLPSSGSFPRPLPQPRRR